MRGAEQRTVTHRATMDMIAWGPHAGKAYYRPTTFLSYVRVIIADLPRDFASYYLEKVMKRQWGSRRDTTTFIVLVITK